MTPPHEQPGVECPDCEQDVLRHFTIASKDEVGVCCPECDAMWLAGRLLPYPGHDRIGSYLDKLGLDWTDVDFGPSTQQVPAPDGVDIHRQVRPRGSRPVVYVVGDRGGSRTPCAYCPSGNLMDAVLKQSGEKLLYCVNCEAVWPTREAVQQQPPTFLDSYLESRRAEWADVVEVGEERGWQPDS